MIVGTCASFSDGLGLGPRAWLPATPLPVSMLPLQLRASLQVGQGRTSEYLHRTSDLSHAVGRMQDVCTHSSSRADMHNVCAYQFIGTGGPPTNRVHVRDMHVR
jgi:hypothetical protein